MTKQPYSKLPKVTEILIAACVEIVSDGKSHIERAADVGMEPEFFSVYVKDTDQIWTCLEDFEDLPAAVQGAQRIAAMAGYSGRFQLSVPIPANSALDPELDQLHSHARAAALLHLEKEVRGVLREHGLAEFSMGAGAWTVTDVGGRTLDGDDRRIKPIAQFIEKWDHQFGLLDEEVSFAADGPVVRNGREIERHRPLRVDANRCDCHPETCCCPEWALYYDDGEKHSMHHSEKVAKRFAAMANAHALAEDAALSTSITLGEVLKGWTIRRDDSGEIVVRALDGSGVVVREDDEDNISAAILHRLATDLIDRGA